MRLMVGRFKSGGGHRRQVQVGFFVRELLGGALGLPRHGILRFNVKPGVGVNRDAKRKRGGG